MQGVHRAPSPAQLQANTQMILQGALIKKQLQDQIVRHQVNLDSAAFYNAVE